MTPSRRPFRYAVRVPVVFKALEVLLGRFMCFYGIVEKDKKTIIFRAAGAEFATLDALINTEARAASVSKRGES